MAKNLTNKKRKMTAFRLRPAAVAALARLAKRTGKTRTRIVEESVLAFSGEVKP